VECHQDGIECLTITDKRKLISPLVHGSFITVKRLVRAWKVLDTSRGVSRRLGRQKGETKSRQEIQKRVLSVESLLCGDDDWCFSMKCPPSMKTTEVVFTMLPI
jgi:hypothetical protein